MNASSPTSSINSTTLAPSDPSLPPSHPMAPTTGGSPTTPSKGSAASAAAAARRRRRRACLLSTAGVLLALSLAALVLSLTVLRVRAPTMRLVSTALTGVAPRLTLLPVPSLRLNVTLRLTVAVHNPNPASFAYASGGHADVSYRGAHVGDAEIAPGEVPSRGDATVEVALTLQADRFVAGDLVQLAEDVDAGALPLDASTRVPGTITVFGLFRRRAVACSECRLVFTVAEMRARSHECRDCTKL